LHIPACALIVPAVCGPAVPLLPIIFFFSSRRRHTRFSRDWSSDVCSSDLRVFTQNAVQSDLAEEVQIPAGPGVDEQRAAVRQRLLELLGGCAARRPPPAALQRGAIRPAHLEPILAEKHFLQRLIRRLRFGDQSSAEERLLVEPQPVAVRTLAAEQVADKRRRARNPAVLSPRGGRPDREKRRQQRPEPVTSAP